MQSFACSSSEPATAVVFPDPTPNSSLSVVANWNFTQRNWNHFLVLSTQGIQLGESQIGNGRNGNQTFLTLSTNPTSTWPYLFNMRDAWCTPSGGLRIISLLLLICFLYMCANGPWEISSYPIHLSVMLIAYDCLGIGLPICRVCIGIGSGCIWSGHRPRHGNVNQGIIHGWAPQRLFLQTAWWTPRHIGNISGTGWDYWTVPSPQSRKQSLQKQQPQVGTSSSKLRSIVNWINRNNKSRTKSCDAMFGFGHCPGAPVVSPTRQWNCSGSFRLWEWLTSNIFKLRSWDS